MIPNHVRKEDAMSERISIHPNVCHGQACIAGTRIPVHQVVRMFANGDTTDDLLRAYPSITREDILRASNMPSHWPKSR